MDIIVEKENREKNMKKELESGNRKRYGKYTEAIAPHIESIKRKIANSKDGTITMKMIDMAKKLGMLNKHKTTIYTGVKYVLFHEGIIVATRTSENGEPIFVMREKSVQDRMPPSMERINEL